MRATPADPFAEMQRNLAAMYQHGLSLDRPCPDRAIEERLDAAVAEYRRRPTRAAVAELMAAQRAFHRPAERTQP